MWWTMQGKDCEMTLERRPAWCDRGRVLAKCFPVTGSALARDWDRQDGWPRYYMRLHTAMEECGLWLRHRGQ